MSPTPNLEVVFAEHPGEDVAGVDRVGEGSEGRSERRRADSWALPKGGAASSGSPAVVCGRKRFA